VAEALVAPPSGAAELELLDEERVRDQLSSAEELHYMGHNGAALIAAGAALAGTLRLCAGPLPARSASCGALLEALRATEVVSIGEHEHLYRLLRAYDRLTRGFAPDEDDVLGPRQREIAHASMARLLERLPRGLTGGVAQGQDGADELPTSS
jgi:hypothetical protein